jgi:NAD(P)-dependent dehydrogenase (short-subunit alcohol dehydrogenase family)
MIAKGAAEVITSGQIMLVKRKSLPPAVLITGASGLLGRSLLTECRRRGLHVLGQYHHGQQPHQNDVSWLPADLATISGTREFLLKNKHFLRSCRYFIHAFGPITVKKTTQLQAEDFLADFTGNFLTAVEICRYLLIKGTSLEAVVFIGFEGVGRVRAYRKVLAHAIAKNALLLLAKSYASEFAPVRFNLVSPTTLKGAKHALAGGRIISTQEAARRILSVLLSRQNGRKFFVS